MANKFSALGYLNSAGELRVKLFAGDPDASGLLLANMTKDEAFALLADLLNIRTQDDVRAWEAENPIGCAEACDLAAKRAEREFAEY